MNKPHPKEVQILSCYFRNHGYSPEENYISIHKSKDVKDTFVSNVIAKTENKNLKINILFSGKPNEISPELLDKLLVTNDSSYNPSRPFRWYRSKNERIIVATTTDPQSIIFSRAESFNTYLSFLGNPEIIWIYEIEEI